MAVYHFSAQVISRSSGRSATAAAAYRAGERIVDLRTGEVHDYTRKGGVVRAFLVLPGHCGRAFTRSELWNAVEAFERRADAQLCREIVVALPRELGLEQNVRLVSGFVEEAFTSAGMCADVSVHVPEGGPNQHAHIMLTMREVDAEGRFLSRSSASYPVRKAGEERIVPSSGWPAAKEDGWEKVFLYGGGLRLTKSEAVDAGLDPVADRVRKQPVQVKRKGNDWDSPGNVRIWRREWEGHVNRALERHAPGAPRVDCRSHAERGDGLIPLIHMGPSARSMEARGMPSVLGEKNRQIDTLNGMIRRCSSLAQLAEEAGAPGRVRDGLLLVSQSAREQGAAVTARRFDAAEEVAAFNGPFARWAEERLERLGRSVEIAATQGARVTRDAERQRSGRPGFAQISRRALGGSEKGR